MMHGFIPMIRRLLAAGSLLALSAGAATACAICLSAIDITPGQRIDNADQVVLVSRSTPDMPPEVAAVLKGDGNTGDLSAALEGEDVPTQGSGQALVLLRDGLGQSWSVLGSVGLDQAEWITRFAATPQPPDLSHAAVPHIAWLQRLGVVLKETDNADPFVADLVTGELTRAPYAALRMVGSRQEAQALLAHIDGDSPPARHAPYYAMLGSAGDADDAALIEARLDTARQRGDATDVAGLLAADLDLRGAARVDWVEETYLLDRARSLAEIEAALKALHVHGDIDGEVTRARIVAAYQRLIRERLAMAGFVAPELVEWQEWGATADYVALLKSGAITDPASEFAIQTYVEQSQDAKAGLELSQ